MGKFNLNVRISDKERELLNNYCFQNERTQTEVIRELIRSLEIKKNIDN